MSNNAPDYEGNLAFEPKMTWKELVEFAKAYGFKETVNSSGKYLSSGYNPVYGDDGYVEIGGDAWYGPIPFEDMKIVMPILLMEKSK